MASGDVTTLPVPAKSSSQAAGKTFRWENDARSSPVSASRTSGLKAKTEVKVPSRAMSPTSLPKAPCP